MKKKVVSVARKSRLSTSQKRERELWVEVEQSRRALNRAQRRLTKAYSTYGKFTVRWAAE